MNRDVAERIPTNLIIGFLGAGKTTAITNLIHQRPAGEKWSILINEFGVVSIDHALVEHGLDDIAIEELGGGCACCTLAFVFQPLLSRFIERTKPDRLILEPSGLSHPANVVDILRSPSFADLVDLRNIICLIDPKDLEDVRWRDTAVFQDQVQLADIVVLNWTDERERELIDSCRDWLEGFCPPKQLIVETSHGALDSELLDMEFQAVRSPIFANAHRPNEGSQVDLPVLDLSSGRTHPHHHNGADPSVRNPTPHQPLRFQNADPVFDACGWIFHVDDIFDRDELLDLLGYVHPIVRLKGVFRCQDDWWMINRAKDGTCYAPSAYRRDSRLEIIAARKTSASGWCEFEAKLLACLAK